MNSGKSQTWFYYASLEMEKLGIEYVMKIDTDSLIYLDRYFTFADHSLPPAPYNKRILAGTPVDKAGWKLSEDDTKKQEAFFIQEYSSLHFYAAGQMYMLSQDLAAGVSYVAAQPNVTKTYLAGHEDHDVSTMAFLALQYEIDNPIKFVMIPQVHNWWLHNLKFKFGISKWKATWDAEISRMGRMYSNHTKVSIEMEVNTTIDSIDLLNPSTVTHSKLINISEIQRLEWLDDIQKLDFQKLTNNLHEKLDDVQINNSIATKDSCFMGEGGHLNKELHIIQLNAEGGKHWSELASFIREKVGYPQIIILNLMDAGMVRSGNCHTVEHLAVELAMNFAFGIEYVDLNRYNDNGENSLGFNGHAILSSCQMFQPALFRDPIDETDIVKTKHFGSRTGIFVRIGHHAPTEEESNHIVVGSVHKLDPQSNKVRVWQYQFGHNPEGYIFGTSPWNQLGIVVAGDMSRDICGAMGLNNLDRRLKHKTWPIKCDPVNYGRIRRDNFCGNLVHYKRRGDSSYLPCYKASDASPTIQISEHSIIAIELH